MNRNVNDRMDPAIGSGRSEAFRTFFDDVLQEVKFSWDHDEIRAELEEHILEECAFLETKGLPAEVAETEALRRMGDPRSLGKLLNTAHQPWIGRLWLLTNTLMAVMLIVFVVNLYGIREMNEENTPFGWTEAENQGVMELLAEDTVFHVTCDETLQLEQYQIHFTDVVCFRISDEDSIYVKSDYGIYLFYERTGEGGEEAITCLTPSFFRDDQGRTLAWNAPWLDDGLDDWNPSQMDGRNGVYGATYSASKMGRFRIYGFTSGTKYIDVVYDFFGQRASCRLDLTKGEEAAV
ncbi:MAG: permease prefix domain 1-containing protein [Anaerovoracaceae bacterium]